MTPRNVLLLLASAALIGGCPSDKTPAAVPAPAPATKAPAAAAPPAAPVEAAGPAEEGPAAGPEGAAAAPVAPAAEAAATPKEPAFDGVPDESHLPPLPDGTFLGQLKGDQVAANLRLVVRDGVMVTAYAEVISERRTTIEFKPAVAPDSRSVALIGRNEGNWLRLNGAFVDAERAAGKFTGTVEKKRVNGRWYAIRR